MIEEFCKYFIGPDCWGWGMFIILVWTCVFPFVIYNTGVEAFELCRRVRKLEKP